MNTPASYCLHGLFAVRGYSPDGDSIRFLPDQPQLLGALLNAERMSGRTNGSVQLRLEGIDAPELHYRGQRQPRALAARRTLLRYLGFRRVESVADIVCVCSPLMSKGAIVARRADTNGRVIAYVLPDQYVRAIPEGPCTLHPRHLAWTANAEMLRSGDAYPMLYSTMPASERAVFRQLAREARAARRGLWAFDHTRSFALHAAAASQGALVFPKLFRRCVAYLRSVADGFGGDLSDWLDHSGAGEDDAMIFPGGHHLRLHQSVRATKTHVRTLSALLEAVFVARL